MKITVSQLRRIIKEEVQRSLRESALPKREELDPILMGLKLNDAYIVYKDGSEFIITRTGPTEYTLAGPDGVKTIFAPDFPMPGPMGQGLALNKLLKFLYGV